MTNTARETEGRLNDLSAMADELTEVITTAIQAGIDHETIRATFEGILSLNEDDDDDVISATTDPATAVSWITASNSDQWFNGQSVRAYGKDRHNHLVAVRTDSGIYPVENLPAILAARTEENAPWCNGDWEDPYEDLDEAEFLESARAYREGRY